jgi:hypothetical protein
MKQYRLFKELDRLKDWEFAYIPIMYDAHVLKYKGKIATRRDVQNEMEHFAKFGEEQGMEIEHSEHPDLNEAAEEAAMQFCPSEFGQYARYEFSKGFKAGAMWKEEQLKKKK